MPKRMHDLPAEYLIHREHLQSAIGGRMRVRREQLDLTQEMLRARLELADAFISRTQLSRLENGEALPDALEIIAISTVLGVSYSWLLTGEE